MKGLRAPRLDAVAARAGVSAATVSRAIHNPELVAPGTLERVRRAVEEVGYRPNVFASGLMKRSSRLLGVVVGDEVDGVVSARLTDALRAARELGYAVLLVPTACLAGGDADLPALGLVDGVLVLDRSSRADEVARAVGGGVPIEAGEGDAGEMVGRVVGRIIAREPSAGGRVTPRAT